MIPAPPMRIVFKGAALCIELSMAEAAAYHRRQAEKHAGTALADHHLAQAESNRFWHDRRPGPVETPSLSRRLLIAVLCR